MTTYKYAVLRYVHDFPTGEFVNVGVVVRADDSGAVLWRVNERFGRISRFFQDFDGTAYRQMVRQLLKRARDVQAQVAQRDLLNEGPSSFDDVLRLLSSPENICFQWSSVFTGLAENLDNRLANLYAEYVTANEESAGRTRRDENEISRSIEQALVRSGLHNRVSHGVKIATSHYSYEFSLGWQNGTQQVLEPISLDYLSPTDIVEKANTWSGRLYNLSKSADFRMTGVVAPPSTDRARAAFEDALAILNSAPNVRRILLENDVLELTADIERDLSHEE